MGVKIKQHDITDCGAACIASICAHYKLKLPIARIRQKAGTDQKGTNLLGMIAAVEQLGFSAKGVKAQMAALSKIPLPAIAHVIVNKQLHHYVVLYKVEKSSVLVMDPGMGRLEKWPTEKFQEMWTGVLLLLAPNDTFETGTQKISVGKRFWHLLQPHRFILVQALLGAIVYTLLGLASPIYIQKITDQVLGTGNTSLLNLLSVVMLCLVFVQLTINWLKSIFVLKTGQMIDAALILGYYKHLLSLPQRFFDTMRIGEILSRIGDAVKIRTFINDVAINIVVNVLILVFSLLLMFTYYWKFAALMLLTLPLYLLIYWISNRLNKVWERKLMEDSAGLETQLVESLNNIRTIKQFGLEGFTNVKTEQKFVSLLNTIFQSGKNQLVLGNASELVSRLFTIVLLWAGTYFVLDRHITPGELLSFYALIGYFNGPVSSLIGMNRTIQNAWIAADRLFEIIDLETESSVHAVDLNSEQVGDIVLDNVDFNYGTRKMVFKNLSLTFKKGASTGIVGESGCGKSTIVSMLQKLYPINGGKIRFGHIDLHYVSNRSLRKIVAVVPQQIDIFAGTVLENIAIGDPYPNFERVIDLCHQLGILPFIESLPGGFGALLGENGANLSGGQKQRLGIARALYRDPEVLIMDEATSSLDSSSEAFVQNTIHALQQQGKTIIIIAHRLSTVMDTDKIIVLHDGKLMEEGNHQELLEQRGAYFSLWAKQFPMLLQTSR
ncbi:peptidase domain-containing ABC transporter [Haliscomenobacter hydrossis]|uniref:Multidrug resistance-like ATP-binding protein MdlB n=1 Tax=Haliscomenobacter hydrossis (strain ATCC 27775 / DSM 1100 / LMG 10767 / O) TaxID=760192 RepID=F4KYM0_HALH1|nr:peptidase domain-containing ABC transporter [Haliscomenobacter hydrossis]AEE50426.1 Xenobiotic-transporting ATPase [Haliscomenobacter hydrossis DSM 1100]